MAFGVFIHLTDSIYDDSPAERYQFPRQYLSRVEACVGDWIVYYKPRKVAETRGYFAIAKAISGLKLINGGRRAEVAAAHIQPVHANAPNIVSNGLALSGTAHWMFDRRLISLTDDLDVLVSRHANDTDSVRAFINRRGRAIALERAFERPHPHFLRWHRDHCFKQ
jgi:hypothetical protein